MLGIIAMSLLTCAEVVRAWLYPSLLAWIPTPLPTNQRINAVRTVVRAPARPADGTRAVPTARPRCVPRVRAWPPEGRERKHPKDQGLPLRAQLRPRKVD